MSSVALFERGTVIRTCARRESQLPSCSAASEPPARKSSWGHSVLKTTGHALATAAAAAAITLSSALPASAEKVGEFNASGFIFKDNVQVMSLEDPKVKGVTIWVADYNRSLAAKLQKDFFSEPSQASVTCAITGPVTINGTLGGADGEEIFSEGKNLFQTKTLRIRRLVDVKNNSLVYVAYSTRLSSTPDKDSTGGASRYRTSICGVSLPPKPAPPTVEPIAGEMSPQ